MCTNTLIDTTLSCSISLFCASRTSRALDKHKLSQTDPPQNMDQEFDQLIEPLSPVFAHQLVLTVSCLTYYVVYFKGKSPQLKKSLESVSTYSQSQRKSGKFQLIR